jgi:hypothetical protein
VFAILQRLVTSLPMYHRSRPSLSPGRLYAKMSAEFRIHRTKVGCSCVMPLPATRVPAGPGACNWELQPLWSQCEACDRYLADLVPRFQALYDVRDPTAVPAASVLDSNDLVNRLG